MNKYQLDRALVQRKLVPTRSQANSYIKLGVVRVDGLVVTQPDYEVGDNQTIRLSVNEQYVSRAALKLASVAHTLSLHFSGKIILDVGSSTGGFTDYALKHGAQKVIAVELGTDQMHASLRGSPSIELHEKTDIRDFQTTERIDLVLADVSFISLRAVLPWIARLCTKRTDIVVMVKPQFETLEQESMNKGVVKNDRMRRLILKEFEEWSKTRFRIINKADSTVLGAKGNQERFYHLQII